MFFFLLERTFKHLARINEIIWINANLPPSFRIWIGIPVEILPRFLVSDSGQNTFDSFWNPGDISSDISKPILGNLFGILQDSLSDSLSELKRAQPQRFIVWEQFFGDSSLLFGDSARNLIMISLGFQRH